MKLDEFDGENETLREKDFGENLNKNPKTSKPARGIFNRERVKSDGDFMERKFPVTTGELSVACEENRAMAAENPEKFDENPDEISAEKTEKNEKSREKSARKFAKNSQKPHKKLKIILSILSAIFILLIFAVFLIFAFSTRAIDDFRGAATQQIKVATAGKSAGETVKLTEIPFADFINPTYKNVKNLAPIYEKMFADVKNFVEIREIHDALVLQYNSGINGENVDGNAVRANVEKYAESLRKKFPREADKIAKMENLATKVAASAHFDDFSADFGDILTENDTWLNRLREDINSRITDFQNKVNEEK